MTIKFSDVVFEEPVLAWLWTPPRIGGLYAILVPDSRCSPRPFRPIYFGETEDFAGRGFLEGHHKYHSWVRQAGSGFGLYVAIFRWPEATKAQRTGVESMLIRNYRPECNEVLGLGLYGLLK
ncbi:MAG: hypothetical protein K2Y35_07370 [Burkholderiales bacterium]|nr:hypothetical protein [Burkholderiales bacterium]